MVFFPASLVPPALLFLLAAARSGGSRGGSDNKAGRPYLKTHHLLLRQIGGGGGGGGDEVGGADAGTSSSSSSSYASSSSSTVWVDMENVRGRSGFVLTHQQVLDRTALWTKHYSLQGRVIVVVDHGGPTSSAYYLRDKQLAVVFSGNRIKADDVIAGGVALMSAAAPSSSTTTAAGGGGGVGRTLVVTADNELQARCRKGAGNEFHLMDPQLFLDDMEWVMNSIPDGNNNDGGRPSPTFDGDDAPIRPSWSESVKLGRLDAEIRLRGQLLDAEIQLDDGRRKARNTTNKRRKKLQARIQALRRKLALRGPSLLDQLTSVNAGPHGGVSQADRDHSDPTDIGHDEEGGMRDGIVSREEQDLLMSRWRELQHRPSRKEQTGDRIIYAERLRRQLDDDVHATKLLGLDGDREGPATTGSVQSALAFVRHINGALPQPSSPSHLIDTQSLSASSPAVDGTRTGRCSDFAPEPPKLSTSQRLAYENTVRLDAIKLVVVSDTHGFEGQLSQPLPEGHVLLHLGDFTLEGSHEVEHKALAAFDMWLARQPHEYKIVIRGNHDPFQYDFPVSKALFVTAPTSINIGGFEMALVPHGSPRKLTASGGIPPSCDVIASHLPPYKVLDRTYTGKFAGSSFLCNVVRGMPLGPPRLWLAGHIHEGRGIATRPFGKHRDRETTVINAANANSGRATHLTHGPVVVQLEKDDDAVQVLQMDDESLYQVSSKAAFYQSPALDGNNNLLLAVDLGLKSGISLFSSRGELLRYEQFLFERETFQGDIVNVIEQWEQEIGEASSGKVTHIAIEGGDTQLLGSWAQAASEHSILRVSPEEWRSQLLTHKENQSGASAKAASRLIARQIVEDYGTMGRHAGKFSTDVAESVVLGLYVARRLGWIDREPAVRRYTNGNVVTPPKILIDRA